MTMKEISIIDGYIMKSHKIRSSPFTQVES